MADAAPVVHELVADLDYPMFIVTATNGRERSGCLVGFATQCSINPPRFLVCLSDKNRTYRVAREAQLLVVHLVPAEADQLAELFGSQTGDEIDKFERCDWHDGPGGTPVLDRKSTRLNSSHGYISYAVFCLKKKKGVERAGE